MATVLPTARLSARIASRYAPRHASKRGFTTSPHPLAAQPYTMPALSPTMTEGNIAAWRVKEGDSYHVGDVILEIETDKATMDVEAQDDGVVFRILEGDGSKGVKVGKRIAVMAEEGDDLSTLEAPVEEEGKKSEEAGKGEEAPVKEEKQSEQQSAERSPEGGTREISPNVSDPTTMTKPLAETPTSSSGGAKTRRKEPYPLLPATMHALHRNGLADSDAEKITPSGPGGRLLKGDVLAYLGKIRKEYPAQLEERVERLTHLDLSKIEVAAPAKAEALPPSPSAGAAEAAQLPPKETKIALPISLTAVIATQKRVQETLGIFLPLSTFVARASELANESLPLSKRKPTADDLFNSVLGLDKVGSARKHSRGRYVPQVTALPSVPIAAPRREKAGDIIDLLSSRSPSARKAKPVAAIPAAVGVTASGENLFSVTARAGEERRATEYLARLKLTLEREPGRLVL